MLANYPMTTMLPVVDLPRAQRFYEQSLGLKPLGAQPNGTFLFDCHGSQLALYPRDQTKADHTAVSFEVEDIESEVKDLTRRGVEFQDYDLPNSKTVNKVCVMGSEKAAWFKDTEGNILCLHQSLL